MPDTMNYGTEGFGLFGAWSLCKKWMWISVGELRLQTEAMKVDHTLVLA